MPTHKNTLTVCRASAGTGKTYTLAARYIALLMDSESNVLYRHILAVTFTNKATAEMKQRILSYLYIIAEGDSHDRQRTDFIANMRNYMNTKRNDEELALKARILYHNILSDFDNMRISTIDSFLQTLISGMARMIGISADFGVELDIDHVVSTAVDEIMTTHIADDKRTLGVLTRYVEQQLEIEKTWDVRSSLIVMTKLLVKEAVLKNKDDIILDPHKIKAYQEAIYWKKARCITEMGALHKRVCNCKSEEEINAGKAYYDFISRIGKSIGGKCEKIDDAFRPMTERQIITFESGDLKKKVIAAGGTSERADEINKTIARMLEICHHCRKVYLTWLITSQYLNDMSMMQFISDRINQNLQEANCILQARTAYVLSTALQPGDADFILEKAGIRYGHVMIDEFQDTSTLQWQIFHDLIKEVLASGGSALVVGDIKQSIYRWRNGDYNIMASLGTAQHSTLSPYHTDVAALTRNYRSEARVVKFNLEVFSKLISQGAYAHEFAYIYREGQEGYSDEHLKDFHSRKHTRGYVEMRSYGYKHNNSKGEENELRLKDVMVNAIQDMFNSIQKLIEGGIAPQDIIILVRRNSEARLIASAYKDSDLIKRHIRMVSNDSFVLENSESVLILVNALKYIYNGNSIAREYLIIHNISIDSINNISTQLPLNELVEEVMRTTLCDNDGIMRCSDQSYLNCFIDEVHGFVSQYSADLKGLLRYWDDSMHKKAIASSGNNGIRVLTIHTAKGLEAHSVFIPFCNWDIEDAHHPATLWVDAPKTTTNDNDDLALIPVKARKGIEETDYNNIHQQELKAQRIDNLNLLYVALTRAAANLIVYTYVKKTTNLANPKDVGELLLSCIDNGQDMLNNIIRQLADDIALDNKPSQIWSVGEMLVEKESRHSIETPFEYTYKNDESQSYQYYIANNSIQFKQSQEAMQYMLMQSDTALHTAQQIQAGIIRHNIFSEIATMQDANNIVDAFYVKGLIESPQQAASIKEEISRTWQDKQMADWFGGTWQVLREVSILRPKSEYLADVEEWNSLPHHKRGMMPKREMRPDRVMIKGNKAVVLDFKFGHQDIAKHSMQVKQYMHLMSTMGYSDIEGWIWYGKDYKLVNVAYHNNN